MNTQTPFARYGNENSGGFSLVELLVAVVIGLIGIVMMFQVASNADQRRRTTAAGSDAQIEGAIALYNFERDIKLAGHGFGGAVEMGCTVNAFDTIRGANFQFRMTPVEITDGAGGAPDQLAVLYGTSPLMSISQSFTGTTATSKLVATNGTRTGLLRGDLVLAAFSTTLCQSIEVTGNTNADGRSVDHAANGTYTDQQTAQVQTVRYNPSATPAGTTGTLFNLGHRDFARRNIWQISNNRALTVRDELHYTSANGAGDLVEVADGVVNLQAQYGLDTTATRDYLVDTWQATAPADWTRVVALRIALLTRSQQFEKENVTTVAPAWTGGAFTMTNVDGAADSDPATPNNWRRYRYRVYESVIPVRNAVWGTAP